MSHESWNRLPRLTYISEVLGLVTLHRASDGEQKEPTYEGKCISSVV